MKLLTTPRISDPALSPDGLRVAYVCTVADLDADKDRSQIWLVACDGSSPAAPLCDGTSPRWSPDGRTLAIVCDGALLLVSPDRPSPPIRLAEKVKAPAQVAWSPDGKVLAFSAIVDLAGERPDGAPRVIDRGGWKADGAGLTGLGARQVFTVAASGDEPPRQLTEGRLGAHSPAWSPDGQRLVVGTRGTLDTDREPGIALAVIDTAGADRRLVAPARGIASAPTWLDDHTVLYVGQTELRTGHNQLLRIDTDTAEITDVSPALDRNVMAGAPGYPGGPPAMTADGTTVCCVRHRGCTHLVTTDGRTVLGDPTTSVVGVSVVGNEAAVILASLTSTGEVAVVDIPIGDHRVLTSHGPSDALPVRRERSFTAPDGAEVHGWILGDHRNAPLLLDVHGGPHNAWGPTFDDVHLYQFDLVDQGWNILMLNVRASDGYGEEWFRASIDSWGRGDTGDFLAAVDELIADGTTDPERVAVSGYSYGGYMACWLTATTDRFAAAMAGGVVSDLRSMAGTGDLGPAFWRLEFEGSDAARLDDLSPIAHVDGVTVPTLIIHGERDDRCSIGQAEQWYSALRYQGVTTQLVRYPGASHMFILSGKPSQRRDFNDRTRDWLVRYTKPKAERPTALPLAARLAGLERRVQDWASRFDVPALSVAVRHDDEVVAAAWGVGNRSSGAKASVATRFPIGKGDSLGDEIDVVAGSAALTGDAAVAHLADGTPDPDQGDDQSWARPRDLVNHANDLAEPLCRLVVRSDVGVAIAVAANAPVTDALDVPLRTLLAEVAGV